ncbi:MAG: hypothetical protein CMF74_13870 [Maricaulis sp.]|nr:hypothetical protein [Maricaulis sp.]
MSGQFSKNNETTVGRFADDLKWDRPKKGKLRIMPISDSAFAPTGFGTNTKNVSAILHEEGHHIGYGGCQNSRHGKWYTPWPLGQTEKEVYFEALPIMFPGQERFGEKSFPNWVSQFNPDLVLGHLDFQMFQHITAQKTPSSVQIPFYKPDGKLFNRKERMDMMNQAFKQVSGGVPWKFACIVPYDGEPSIPSWQHQCDAIDYAVAMSRYGQQGLKKDFDLDTTYIPHGVDTNFFKPKLYPKYGNEDKPDAFIVGCVARNQHRKNLPRLIKGFAQFVKQNNLSSDQAKLILHMDWNDAMGWKFPDFAEQYGLKDYLMPPLMGSLDHGQALTEEGMVDLYNCMDVFVLPTAGEGFGIPSVEAMACGVPLCITNYTTGYELIASKDAENEEVPMFPLGGHFNDPSPNGRDHLEEEDIHDRGILIPYKDMWWDTPARAAPQRAIASENAIAQALEYYYKNPDKRLAASVAARKHAVENYSWEVIGQRWVDWINKITPEIKK